jgi:Zn-dependent peptidase ImmA (M78 family)
MSPKEIRDKAREVNDISLDYHLSHALCASNALIKQTAKEHLREKITALKIRLQTAIGRNDTVAIVQIRAEIELLSRPVLIYVEYIDNMMEDGGRVVWINSQLIISLPKKLANDSRSKDGSLNSAGVSRLREIMAHELGHIMLHIDEWLDTDNLRGDKLLSDDAEAEAWSFARELLELRHARNEQYFKSGAYKNL